MKKRFLAIVLTLVMALALAVPSLAASANLPTYTYSYVVDEDDHATDQNLKNVGLIKVVHPVNGVNLYGYVNPYGQVVVQPKYTAIGNFTADKLAWAVKDGVGVYVNAQGAEVISVGVATPYDFRYGMARVVDHHNNTRYINTSGTTVFNQSTEIGTEFNEYGLAGVRSNVTGKWGIVNKLGQVVTHFNYDWFDVHVDALDVKENELYPQFGHDNELLFESGLLRGKRGSVYDFIRPDGSVAFTIDPTALGLVYVDRFKNGMCLVRDVNDQVGYVDTTGYLAVYCQYEAGERFNEFGIARIKRNGLYGYINKINAYAVQPIYTALSTKIKDNLVLGLRYVPEYKTNKYGYVNIYTGYEQVGFTFDVARDFSEGLAYVGVYGQYGLIHGFINTAGTVVINASFYSNLGDFHSGLAWAERNGKYGYINTNGVLVITARYDVDYTDVNGKNGIWDVNRAPYDFRNGLAVVRMADFSGASRYGIINTAGAILYNPTFSGVIFFRPEWNDNVALFQYAGINNSIVILR